MTLIIVDKRKAPYEIHYDKQVTQGDYVVLENDQKVVELNNFWYGMSGTTIYDILFEYLDSFFTKKKVDITRINIYEGVLTCLKKCDFDLKDERGFQTSLLQGFIISKNQTHFDIIMEGNKIIDICINREKYYAYGMRHEALHLMDAGIQIPEVYKICGKRCVSVGNSFDTITLPQLTKGD